MTANRRADSPENIAGRSGQHDDADHSSRDAKAAVSVPGDAVEAILRQVVGMRAAGAVDDQLAQLIRMVDSATWSAPVPMTVLVDGALLRGVLVPSEVNAAYLDDALARSARAAVDQLDEDNGDSTPGAEGRESETERNELVRQQARAFLRRIRRRPFSTSQARIRQRNANALMALSRWHQTREPDIHLTPLDIPGTYADPASGARDVIPYATGQRALTLADVKMLIAGEWLAIPAPLRVSVGRIGAWAVDQ